MKESMALDLLDNCSQSNMQLVFFDDELYLKDFLLVPDFSPLLFCEGNSAFLINMQLLLLGLAQLLYKGAFLLKN